MIIARINGQDVRTHYDTLAADSVEYLTIKFEYSDEWQGYSKTAVFENKTEDKTVSVVLCDGNPLYLGDDTCLVPFEVIKSPEFTVSVFGVNGESLITSNVSAVKIAESGYAQGEEPSEPTQSEYQQIINIVTAAKEAVDSVREDIDKGVFGGEKGDKGDKGDKGESGVYVGSGEMPDGYNVQIDPEGATFDISEIKAIASLYADYIVKQGTNMPHNPIESISVQGEGWHYNIYNSGLKMCWGVFKLCSNVAISKSNGSLYYGPEGSIEFPDYPTVDGQPLFTKRPWCDVKFVDADPAQNTENGIYSYCDTHCFLQSCFGKSPADDTGTRYNGTSTRPLHTYLFRDYLDERVIGNPQFLVIAIGY